MSGCGRCWTRSGRTPTDWERFNRSPAADFAAWPDDGEWRSGFARYFIEEVLPNREEQDFALARSEEPPEDWRILECLARDEEREIDTAAIHAALRDVPPEPPGCLARGHERRPRADRGGSRGAARRSGGGARRHWRICDPRRRFRYDVVRRPARPGQWRYGGGREIGRLAWRMEAQQDAALAQLKRECGPAWPSAPAKKPAARICYPSRKPVPVERRAFAFDATAPGVLEGVLVPYGVPVRIGGAFEEVFESGSLLADNCLLVYVRHEWGSPLARSGKGLQLEDGPSGLRATVTLPDTGASSAARGLSASPWWSGRSTRPRSRAG